MSRHSDRFCLLSSLAFISIALLPVQGGEVNREVRQDQFNLPISKPRIEFSFEAESGFDETKTRKAVEAKISAKKTSLKLLTGQGSLEQVSKEPGSKDQAPLQFDDLSLKPLAVLEPPPSREVLHVSTGEASWYGPGFFGNRTASGEVFRPGTMTAAHRTLPFGTKVRVTNLWNGRSAVVRINDRGPFRAHRVIDLAHGAAHHLGLAVSGIAQVRLEVLR